MDAEGRRAAYSQSASTWVNSYGFGRYWRRSDCKILLGSPNSTETNLGPERRDHCILTYPIINFSMDGREEWGRISFASVRGFPALNNTVGLSFVRRNAPRALLAVWTSVTPACIDVENPFLFRNNAE